MMSHWLCLLLALALTVVSLPTGWSEDEAKFYSEVSKEIQRIRRDGSTALPGCDLSQAKLPQTQKELPKIPSGQRLLAVAVGRGTQNYTCDPGSDKPTPKGAVATLFDASCIAANYPHLLASLTNAALHLEQPKPFSQTPGAGKMPVLGHHFFSNNTTAVFDLLDFGASSVKKADAVDAPDTAMQGVCGQLDGAVPWLFLESISGSAGKARSVYRVDTAGGKPPAHCANQPADITVQYASEYWFYG